MRKIKEEEFTTFTIKGQGWSITLHSFKRAQSEWRGLQEKATLIGNKQDGTQVIIDTN